MAKIIATKEAVFAAADSLAADGADVTMTSVRARTGGSFSTIQTHIESWRTEQADARLRARATPAEIAVKGAQFTNALWSLAMQQAELETQAIRDQVIAEKELLLQQLHEAMTEIAQLETIEAELFGTIDSQQKQLRDTEQSLMEAQTQIRLIPELKSSLATANAELIETRKESKNSAVEAAKLKGEVTALQRQATQLPKPNKSKPL